MITIIISEIMLRATIRFMTVLPGKAFRVTGTTPFAITAVRPAFFFSSGDKHDHSHKHGEHSNPTHDGHKH